MKFKFEMGNVVVITASSETGNVIGRAEYETGALHYLVRYKAADGKAVEAWWVEQALGPAEQ